MNYLTVVDEFFLDRPGGAARVAWDIALMMVELGHHVSMLCKGEKFSTETHAGVRLIRCTAPRYPRWHPRRAIVYARAARQAYGDYLGEQEWDVIHLHTPILGAGVVEVVPPRVRCVYTMHSPVVPEQVIIWARQGALGQIKRIFGSHMLRQMERKSLDRSQNIHVLSEFTRSRLKAEHPEAAAKISVVPHWLRPQFVRQHTKAEARRLLKWPEHATILFTVRRHTPRCGLEVAIDAIAPLAAGRACVFVIAGEGPLSATLERRARDLGAAINQVVFPGRLTDEELVLAYEAADVFILPTVALECFGLIILESLSVGCPVIASDIGAIPELLKPITPQLLVPPADPEALRKTVKDFLAGTLSVPAATELVGYVTEKFSRRSVVPRLAELLTGKAHKMVDDLRHRQSGYISV